MRSFRQRLESPEFFNFWCLLAILIFALNNFYLKVQYGNWLTGKLSDFCACFFLPLFISAIVNLMLDLSLRRRLVVGCIVTGIIFSLVKLSVVASSLLNALLSLLTNALGIGQSVNIPDPSDLIALPLVVLAYYVGIRYRP